MKTITFAGTHSAKGNGSGFLSAMAFVGLWLPVVCMVAPNIGAQPADTILDESKVPSYVLPDPLVMQDGTPVESASAWISRRRPEVLRLFEEHVHGRSPDKPSKILWELTAVQEDAFHGKPG